MTVTVVTWENAHLHGEAWISHHRLRHQIFVSRRGWAVPNHNNLEYDQFDTPAAKYLLWLDHAGRARGVLRLLPTTHPYMMKSLWPELLQGSLPETETIWEATRFGCDHSLEAPTRRRVVAELLCGVIEFGLANGVSQLLALMPVALFKHVIMPAGLRVEIQPQRLRMGSHEVAAGYIEVSHSSLADVRDRTGVRHPVVSSDPVVSRLDRAITADVAA